MKTLAIINEKGGVGKSFIATQFALFCRFKLGNRVLVVDLDQQRNTSDILINSGLCVPTDTTAGLIMKNGGLVKAEEPFMVIPGDDNLLELESMRDAAGITQNLYSALDAVSDNFDLCIIDCSPSADVRQLIVLSLSTHYLIPFQIRIYQWGRKNFSACKSYSGEREQFLGIFGAADEHGEDAGHSKEKL